MEKEMIIIQKYEQRNSLMEKWAEMEETEKNNVKQEMINDHQKVVAWEAEAKGEDRQMLSKLRKMLEKQQQEFQQIDSLEFRRFTKRLSPKQTVLKNTILAFVVGGLICVTGQLITNLFMAGGLLERDAGAATSTVLVFAGAFFTGLGIYDELGKHAGAGSIVPITGFANSIASSALEFKREGFVYGVGARLFTVAGPVIVYGTVVSILIGLIYFLTK